ncbi:MAG TPA: sugar ABC transporter substrate-binding protein [Chloroflexota bacterium]|nr:sugar ABC transporter substrate-binding protein [Chloroflexota bacterium]
MAKVTRRRFVVGLGTGAASLLFSACGAPTPTATPVPAKTAEPAQRAGVSTTTVAPTNAPTPAVGTPPAITKGPMPAEPTKPAAVAAQPAAAKQTASIRFHLRPGGLVEEWFRKQAEAYSKAAGVEVKLELTPDAEYTQKLTTLVAAGDLGDAYWSGPFYVFYPFAARGIALDLNPLVKAENVDLGVFFPSVIKALMWDGKLCGLSYGSHPGYCTQFTNLDAYKEAGAKPPEWEWRYDKEWLDALKATTLDTNRDGTPDRYGFMFPYISQSAYTFIRSWGSDWIEPTELKTSWFTQEKTVAALQFMHDLVHKHKVAPPANGVVQNMFANGLTAAWQDGTWDVANMGDLIKDKFKWQAFGMPAGPEGKKGAFIGNNSLSVNKSSKYPNETFRWILWLCSKENGLAQADSTTPGPRFDVWADPKVANNPNYKDALRWISEISQPASFPKNARVTEFNTTVTQGFQAFMLETGNPRAKIEELNKAVQAILDKPLL